MNYWKFGEKGNYIWMNFGNIGIITIYSVWGNNIKHACNNQESNQDWIHWWNMGKIVKLIESKDDEIRAASVLHPDGNTIKRPIDLSYSLETAPADTIEQNVEDNCQMENRPNKISVEQTSKRKAAILAKDRLKTLFNEETDAFIWCRECYEDHEIKHGIKAWEVTRTFKNIWLRNEKLQEHFRTFISTYESEIKTIVLFLATIVTYIILTVLYIYM